MALGKAALQGPSRGGLNIALPSTCDSKTKGSSWAHRSTEVVSWETYFMPEDRIRGSSIRLSRDTFRSSCVGICDAVYAVQLWLVYWMYI
jgi:hypothetical protein